MFQYFLFNCAQFSEELKLLNDYFENYKTGTGLNKNALNQDFRNIQNENQKQENVKQDINAKANHNTKWYIDFFSISFSYSFFQINEEFMKL